MLTLSPLSHIERAELRREEDGAKRTGVHQIDEHRKSDGEKHFVMLHEPRHFFLSNTSSQMFMADRVKCEQRSRYCQM